MTLEQSRGTRFFLYPQFHISVSNHQGSHGTIITTPKKTLISGSTQFKSELLNGQTVLKTIKLKYLLSCPLEKKYTNLWYVATTYVATTVLKYLCGFFTFLTFSRKASHQSVVLI